MKSLGCVRLFVTPWTVAYQASLSMGFSRQKYQSQSPFSSPGDLPDPGIEPRSPALQTDWFTLWATREIFISVNQCKPATLPISHTQAALTIKWNNIYKILSICLTHSKSLISALPLQHNNYFQGCFNQLNHTKNNKTGQEVQQRCFNWNFYTCRLNSLI